MFMIYLGIDEKLMRYHFFIENIYSLLYCIKCNYMGFVCVCNKYYKRREEKKTNGLRMKYKKCTRVGK